MRTFNYRNLPSVLSDGALGDVQRHLFEDKGRLETLEQLHGDVLASLRERAHADNVDASTRIEGLYVDLERVRELIDGAQPAGETEAQVVGYSQALGLIENNADDLALSTATILQFFETLYAHRNLGTKSRYRKKDYMYVQVDGYPQAMPVSPIAAFETPLVLGGACDGLAESFSEDGCDPLVQAAVFTVDFLCIRPFDEGNGRIARLFADLLLSKAGFDVSRYMSIDRIIEESAMDYYNALNACVDGWDTSANDYAPFVLYWLDAIHKAYARLFEVVNLELRAGNNKSERVRLFVLEAKQPVAKRDILSALGNVSEATVESVLGQLVKEGLVEKQGSARATKYVPVQH